MHAVFLVVASLLIYFGEIRCQDVFGCGGFVRSEVEINFSLIEVGDNRRFSVRRYTHVL